MSENIEKNTENTVEIPKRLEKLLSQFPGLVFKGLDAKNVPVLIVQKQDMAAVTAYLKDNAEQKFDYLSCLSGIEEPDKFGVVYHFYSTILNHQVVLKIYTDKDNPEVPSVSSIWITADWFEREAYDMYGIIFSEHPNLKRILLTDDWEGYPLRKDYQLNEPKSYLNVEREWAKELRTES